MLRDVFVKMVALRGKGAAGTWKDAVNVLDVCKYGCEGRGRVAW